MRPTLCLSLLALLCGCSDEANHLGNPLTWPLQAMHSAASNAVYDARRAKVHGFVAANHSAILLDASKGQGPSLATAMDLAQVPKTRRAALARELATNPIYRGDAGALVVALMVHGV